METKAPYFSIVIPTKNRPQLLKDGIRSVLLQDFHDYELIVSDNYNDAETQDVINQFVNHPKFKAVRTDRELKMIDHIEFATLQAKGEYVLVLTDRKVLYAGALKKLFKHISRHPKINTCSFGVQSYDEINRKMMWNPVIGKTVLIKSEQLLQNFLTTNLFGAASMDDKFPKTFNGVFKNSYAQSIREKYGYYFNLSGVTTPDYSSFFINCLLNEYHLFIGEKIILTQGESISNGRLFGAGKFQAYMASLGLEAPYRYVPIEAPLIYNLLLSDLLEVEKHIQESRSSMPIDYKNFFVTCYYEILLKANQGLNEEGQIYFISAWKDGLAKLNFTAETDRYIGLAKNLFIERNRPPRLKLNASLKAHLKDFLYLRFSPRHPFNRIIKYSYNDALHAAGFKY